MRRPGPDSRWGHWYRGNDLAWHWHWHWPTDGWSRTMAVARWTAAGAVLARVAQLMLRS